MVKLYGIPRSRTIRPLWMLEDLGVPYENVPVGLEGQAKTPEFLRLNPNGHIPVLQDGDLVIWESLAINLYLARKYDGGLWPKTVADEGRTYQWSLWAMTELEEPVLTALLHTRVLPEDQRNPKKAADAVERAKRPLGVLEKTLADREHLLGADFTAADLNVASVLIWAPMAAIDLKATPKVNAWYERCVARPAYGRVQQLVRGKKD